MPANTSAWSKSQPSGSSSIRDGDDTIRSDKSVLEAALNDEHYFDPQASASSASGGVHRLGSARIFSGLRASLSTPASADSVNRMYYATDTKSLHIYGASSATTIVARNDIGFIQTASANTFAESGSFVVLGWGQNGAVTRNVGGFVNTAASSKTAPANGAGVYIVSGFVELARLSESTVTYTDELLLRMDSGLTLAMSQVESTGTTATSERFGVTVSAIAPLSEGSAVAMEARHHGSPVRTVAYQRLSLHRISDIVS